MKSGRYKDFFLRIQVDYLGRQTKAIVDGFRCQETSFFGYNEPRPLQHSTEKDEFLSEFVPRRQYRTVVGEICETLCHLGTLREAIDVLQQSLIRKHITYLHDGAQQANKLH